MSYLPPGTFIAVTLVFTGILIFETVRYVIKVKRGEIGKQSWLYAMPAFIFCAIFAAVERFFRAYIPVPSRFMRKIVCRLRLSEVSRQ